MAEICSHTDTIAFTDPGDAPRECPDCIAEGLRWVHLRLCTVCGRIGCCDSSPGKHASKHARAVNHPIMRSIEPGEDWFWCVVDEVAFRVSGAGAV
jgi:hypothetical protein